MTYNMFGGTLSLIQSINQSTLICLLADKKTTHSGTEEASDDDVEYNDEEDEHAPSFYDKSKSFFDNISCDATEKSYGYC